MQRQPFWIDSVHCWSSLVMSIRRYFKPKSGLPDPERSLSKCLPTQAIARLANTALEKAIVHKNLGKKRSVLYIHGNLGCSKLFRTLPCRSKSWTSQNDAATYTWRNSIGSRFGCLLLHVDILSEIWTLSQVELTMLERVYRKILRTIQGLPTRCHSSSLNSMLGSSSIESVIFQRKLNFINSITDLDNNSLPKKLLIKRIQDPMAKGLIPDL